MIASLIVLAQGFKVPVVAEGIEDEAIKNHFKMNASLRYISLSIDYRSPSMHLPGRESRQMAPGARCFTVLTNGALKCVKYLYNNRLVVLYGLLLPKHIRRLGRRHLKEAL
jgi:hypothetical protein